MLGFFKYFQQKGWRFLLKTKLNYAKFGEKMAFLTQNQAKLCKKH
jgi:hypothetical protein